MLSNLKSKHETVRIAANAENIMKENFEKISSMVSKEKEDNIMTDVMTTDDFKNTYITGVIDDSVINRAEDDKHLMELVDILSTSGVIMEHPHEAIDECLKVMTSLAETTREEGTSASIGLSLYNSKLASWIAEALSAVRHISVVNVSDKEISIVVNDEIYKSEGFKHFIKTWFDSLKEEAKAIQELMDEKKAEYDKLYLSIYNLNSLAVDIDYKE